MAARLHLRLLLVAATSLILSATLAGRVSAHASPHVLEILFRPDGYVLLSNRGLIFGEATRTQWRLMCTEVLGINTSEQPSLVVTPGGGLLVGTSRGLTASADGGCSWQGVAPFATTSVPALIADPSTPARLYLAAYTPEPSDLGGLYRSEDAGLNWQKLRPADERDYVRSIAVAPSEVARVYATGQSWDMAGTYTYYLLRSRDSGGTWERTVFELEADEREVELLAVSPSDPALIAVRVASNSPASNPERLLISRDGGATFVSPLSLTLLSAFAFSADGSRGWIAAQDGLFESTDGLLTFTRVGAAESMSYVVQRAGELFAAGYYGGVGAGSNGVGVTRALGEGFDSFMELNEVTAPVACTPDSATAMACGRWWLDWERELRLGQFSPDAGVSAGRGGSAAAAGGGSGGSAGSPLPDAGLVMPAAADRGCAVVRVASPRAGSGGVIGLGLLLLATVGWRRRLRQAA